MGNKVLLLHRFLVDSLFLWKSPWNEPSIDWGDSVYKYLEQAFKAWFSWIHFTLLLMDCLQLTTVYCNRRACKYHTSNDFFAVQNMWKMATGKSWMNFATAWKQWELGTKYKARQVELCISGQHSTTRTPMTTCTHAWHSTIRTSKTTSMLAWHFTMRTPATTSIARHALFSQIVILISSMHMHRGSKFESRFSYHPHGLPRACVLFALTLSFYLLLLLPFLFLFLFLFLTDKVLANLNNSAKEGVDTNDVFSFPTGYEPKAHDFYETTVEPHVQFLNTPALLSNTTPYCGPVHDDSTLEDMLHQAHRAQAYHSLREDLSVSLSSSSVSDRTGIPVGDGPGRLGEHRSSEAQIRTLLD